MLVYLMNIYINLLAQRKHQTKLQKDLVLTISFKAAMARWTLVTFERGEGHKVLADTK
jgi:hypothetical protein